jgi:carbon-monoxide dehydrogenase medium subunit/6-hydroxypseudooxynicotine dehydrogenase subunit alpha
MKPPDFDYVRPADLAEAVRALSDGGEDAKILAGGQSLIPLMNLRLARPSLLVDIGAIAALKSVSVRDVGLIIGSAVTHREIIESAAIQKDCNLLAEAASWIAHPQIRTRGTIGGSLAHADGSAEFPAVLAALDGSVIARSGDGDRTVPWSDLFEGPFSTSLRPDEIITGVVLPRTQAATGTAFDEFARRPGDFAVVGAAAVVRMAPDGTCGNASLALLGVAGVPVRADAGLESLRGAELSESVVTAAVRRAFTDIAMSADVRVSAAYRRRIAEIVACRAIVRAAHRARRALS